MREIWLVAELSVSREGHWAMELLNVMLSQSSGMWRRVGRPGRKKLSTSSEQKATSSTLKTVTPDSAGTRSVLSITEEMSFDLVVLGGGHLSTDEPSAENMLSPVKHVNPYHCYDHFSTCSQLLLFKLIYSSNRPQ